MAASIDATVGGASANSYVAVADATSYFDGRLNVSEWDEASSDEQIRALIQAAYRLEQEQFKGVRVNETQALQWPRYGVEKPDIAYSVLDGPIFTESTWYGTDEIPERIKRAQMELALYLLKQGTDDPMQPTGLEGYRTTKVGSIEVEKDPGFRAGDLPEHVRRFLRPLLERSRGTFAIRRG